MILSVLKKLDKILTNCNWAIFGSVSIFLYYGKKYRCDFNDIDIIIDIDKDKIKEKFKYHGVDLKISKRNNRWRGYSKIDGINIELMFTTSIKTVDLADGKFQYKNKKFKKIEGTILPLVDIGSLYKAKKRHLLSIERDIKNQHNIDYSINKKEKILEDIQIINEIMYE